MPRTHTHWDGGPVCRFPLKRDCDELVAQFNHGHLGRPCIKEVQESKTKRGRMNKVPTCTIIDLPESGRSFDTSLAEQVAQAPAAWRAELEAWQAQQEVH